MGNKPGRGTGDIPISEELGNVKASLEKTFGERDGDGLSKLYDEDCKLMAPGKPVVHGQKGVKTFAEDLWQTGMSKVAIEIEEAVSTGPEWAFARGLVTFSLEDGKPALRGKYTAIYKRDASGQFRYYVDIFNALE